MNPKSLSNNIQILITGGTGNVGREVVHFLWKFDRTSNVILAVRNVNTARRSFTHLPNASFREFNFKDPNTFNGTFKNINILFLLRPPQISNVDKYFKPLLISAKNNGIKNVAFLSVLGAERSSVIPDNKIERLIKTMGFKFIFIRPAYFMQNLTTTLLPELQNNHRIILPSGRAKFNWIDVKNIGEVGAILIMSFTSYENSVYRIYGTENKNFQEVIEILNETLGINYTFRSINPICYYVKKIGDGTPSKLAIVMTLLHYLPRFQKEPEITEVFYKLTGKKPTTLKEFINREKEKILLPKRVLPQ